MVSIECKRGSAMLGVKMLSTAHQSNPMWNLCVPTIISPREKLFCEIALLRKRRVYTLFLQTTNHLWMGVMKSFGSETVLVRIHRGNCLYF